MAPNGPAQVALIREALSSAQVEPDRIGFFEAHGTGTALGDPIEVEAIVEAIGRAQYGSNPCFIGSIKANLGHLEAAAGVTGLIKAVLALRHEMVPPQANFSKLSPHISLDGTRLSVPTTLTPWPSGPLPRCAAVSSFGVGGPQCQRGRRGSSEDGGYCNRRCRLSQIPTAFGRKSSCITNVDGVLG